MIRMSFEDNKPARRIVIISVYTTHKHSGNCISTTQAMCGIQMKKKNQLVHVSLDMIDKTSFFFC